MESISALQNANRVEIFRHLAVDELDGVQWPILDSIAANHFHAFLDFCDKVYAEKDKISSVSCTLENNQLQFHIDYL